MGEAAPKDQKAEKAAPRKPGTYVVLQQNGNGYEVVSSVSALTGTEAKKQVAASMTINEGEAVTLVAVPSKSFQPQTYTVERPAPRLVAA